MKKRIANTISVFEFMRKFPDEKTARDFFIDYRWGEEMSCPHCHFERISILKREGFFRCKGCKKAFTAKTGTIMEKSKVGIRTWLFAMYCVVVARKSVSSLQFSKEVGVTQKTAWFILHRVREAMKTDAGYLLKGVVEMDETYIGGLESNKHRDKHLAGTQGRSTKSKAAVIGVRARSGDVRMQFINPLNSSTIQQFIDKNVVRGSVLATDEARFYKPVRGYHKLLVNHGVGQFVNGMAHTNGIESVWAILKRGYHGTFHHFSKKHLDRYVDEFSFRLNQGNCSVDVIDRVRALCKGACGKRLTYKQLTGKAQWVN